MGLLLATYHKNNVSKSTGYIFNYEYRELLMRNLRYRCKAVDKVPFQSFILAKWSNPSEALACIVCTEVFKDKIHNVIINSIIMTKPVSVNSIWLPFWINYHCTKWPISGASLKLKPGSTWPTLDQNCEISLKQTVTLTIQSSTEHKQGFIQHSSH